MSPVDAGNTDSKTDCRPDLVLAVARRRGHPGKIRASKSGRRRAAVLVLIHVAILTHVAHWLITGTTLSPVEPSESMETLETGRVNAGFVFFAAALAATLIFGRFVCGWACHWIAYQDLCSWLLRKIGIKPKPFRSRVILWVPLIVAVYMFIWPRLCIWWMNGRVPEATNHLTTTEFWATFPGPGMAVVTILLAGFSIVYFLGNKGFCAYACPYGAFFGLLDKAALGRIRVTDACDGCGHCTAACTSNVRVHEQVRDYGMVTDPGCMKTLDCVSVCPKDALYYGFGRPAIKAPKRVRSVVSRVRRAFSWSEEIVLAALFAGVFFSIRGLYQLFPLLASVGFAGILSYAGLTCLRMLYRPHVRLHNFVLKRSGGTHVAGWVVAGVVAGLFALVAHSGLVQHHTRLGIYHYDRIDLSERERPGPTPKHDDGESPMRSSVARSMAHLRWVERWALCQTVEVAMKLGWLHAISGRPTEAERYFRRAIRLAPDRAPAYYVLGNLLMDQGRRDEAIAEYTRALEYNPDFAEAHYNLGGVLMMLGRPEEAVPHYRQAVRITPHDPEAQNKLGVALASTGHREQAFARFREALRLKPTYAEPHFHLSVLHAGMGDLRRSQHHLEKACWLDPRFCDVQP